MSEYIEDLEADIDEDELDDNIEIDDDTDEYEPVEDVEYEFAEVDENPSIRSVGSGFMTTARRITLKKVISAGLGLATPIVIPKFIGSIINRPEISSGVIGIVISFLSLIVATMVFGQFASPIHTDDFLTGGLACLGVNIFGMIANYIQSRTIPSQSAVSGARHELYVPETRGLNPAETINELSAISKEVIAPTFEGIESIGSGIYY